MTSPRVVDLKFMSFETVLLRHGELNDDDSFIETRLTRTNSQVSVWFPKYQGYYASRVMHVVPTTFIKPARSQ